MQTKYQQEEEAVECAVEEAQAAQRNGDPINFAALAIKYKVNRLRVWRRYCNGKSKSTRAPTNRLLTDSQEAALLAWVNILDGLEISARPDLIKASANQLLRDAWEGDPSSAPVVGA
ncbi:hypothetical protein CF326_g3891, partial [Tilletia indica]